MKNNQISFICTQLGITDYFTWHENNTFADLIENLKNKYEIKIIKFMQNNFQNIRENISLNNITLKLFFFDKNGSLCALSNYIKVSDIVSEGITKIYWTPEPIGGNKFVS